MCWLPFGPARPGLSPHQLHTASELILLAAGGKGVNCINGGSLWRCQTDGRGGAVWGRRSPCLKNDAKIDISLGQRVGGEYVCVPKKSLWFKMRLSHKLC